MTENFSSNYDRSCVEIDLDALKHNFEEIKKATKGGAGILAVVKADAYGHGAIEIAKTLIDSGAAGLCLATIDEAVELRKHGIDVPMMTLGFTDPVRFKDAVKYGEGFDAVEKYWKSDAPEEGGNIGA